MKLHPDVDSDDDGSHTDCMAPHKIRLEKGDSATQSRKLKNAVTYPYKQTERNANTNLRVVRVRCMFDRYVARSTCLWRVSRY